MATQTTVLDLTKPAGNENALISVINGNMDKVDAEAGKVRGNVAATYSSSSAYAVGDLCIHDGNLYSCNTAIGSGGEDWAAAHWTQTAIADEIPEVVDNLTTTSSTKALSAGQGKTLADQIATNFTRNGSSWFNSSYISSGEATLIQIGNLCIVQLTDVKFSQEIANATASNQITLVTLPFSESSGGQVFIMSKANEDTKTIRLQLAGSVIRPWWSAIPKTTSGDGWFGMVVFKKS